MKDIIINENRKFRVSAVQLQGRLVDANGVPVDSGNSLVNIVPEADTALPETEVVAELTPTASDNSGV